MAYLDTPRLTFSGQFQADPSTVNNNPTHFNNDTFKPNYQLPQTPEHYNGWWNPEGTGNFRFVGCTVKSVTYNDGTTTTNPDDDWIIGKTIIDSNERVAAKIVDLDPSQQSVSELWGLTVRLSDDGTDVFNGPYKVAPFADIWWVRSLNLQADSGASAFYQSTFDVNGSWNDDLVAKSKFLQELKAKSENQLSIKFNTDVYNDASTTPEFTLGRCIGSIGPSNSTEPNHFTLGRQFVPDMTLNNQIPGYLPNNNIYFATAKVNTLSNGNHQIAIDLGASFQTKDSFKATNAETRDLYLAVNENGSYTIISEIDYQFDTWMTDNSGIVNINLDATQFNLVENNPLCIVEKNGTDITPLLPEVAEYVRADNFVHRINVHSTDSYTSDLYATNLGKIMTNTDIVCEFQNNLISQFGQGQGSVTQGGDQPALGTPLSALTFNTQVTTDSNGKAQVSFDGNPPGNPRGYIDGQLYSIWYYIKGQPTVNFAPLPDTISGLDPNNFISVLVFNDTQFTFPVTWEQIQPTLQQYSNLYPLMSRKLFNFADKAQFDAHANILKFAFNLEVSNPNYMPATRDLSQSKLNAINNYLDQIIAQYKKTGKPEQASYSH